MRIAVIPAPMITDIDDIIPGYWRILWDTPQQIISGRNQCPIRSGNHSANDRSHQNPDHNDNKYFCGRGPLHIHIAGIVCHLGIGGEPALFQRIKVPGDSNAHPIPEPEPNIGIGASAQIWSWNFADTLCNSRIQFNAIYHLRQIAQRKSMVAFTPSTRHSPRHDGWHFGMGPASREERTVIGFFGFILNSKTQLSPTAKSTITGSAPAPERSQ